MSRDSPGRSTGTARRTATSNLIVPSPREQKALHSFAQKIAASKPNNLPKLVGPDGTTIEIPPSLFDVLQRAVKQLVEGRAVSVLPVTLALTTQQAADLLNVSRPHLVKLIERGEIAYHMVGSHRRIYLRDLAGYRAKREGESREALASLVADAQELGMYEE
jgi:excisionase family DNA binding protein